MGRHNKVSEVIEMDGKTWAFVIPAVVLVTSLGIASVLANITNRNDSGKNIMDMTEMTDMHEAMDEMEEMLGDEDFEKEMAEHMKSCPMMKRIREK